MAASRRSRESRRRFWARVGMAAGALIVAGVVLQSLFVDPRFAPTWAIALVSGVGWAALGWSYRCLRRGRRESSGSDWWAE
jgi:hypothetical protein